MDRVRPSGRVPAPVRVPSSPHPNTNFVLCLPPRISSISGAPSGDREDAGQRSAGDRSRSGPGFYSRLFLVEKATGGWRPVIDLSTLNTFIRQTPFKMETVASVLNAVQENDLLASLDLKDAYFQVPVHPSSRKFLRFVSQGTVYQFKVLCFGRSTAPQVFTRVFAAVSAWSHSRGIRLLRYLDDWLVLASSETKARQHVQDLLLLCHDLGIVVNKEKSDLMPSCSASYLGMTIDTVAGKVSPSRARVEKFLRLAGNFVKMNSPPLLGSGRCS